MQSQRFMEVEGTINQRGGRGARERELVAQIRVRNSNELEGG